MIFSGGKLRQSVTASARKDLLLYRCNAHTKRLVMTLHEPYLNMWTNKRFSEIKQDFISAITSQKVGNIRGVTLYNSKKRSTFIGSGGLVWRPSGSAEVFRAEAFSLYDVLCFLVNSRTDFLRVSTNISWSPRSSPWSHKCSEAQRKTAQNKYSTYHDEEHAETKHTRGYPFDYTMFIPARSLFN